jgi:hypothetical protein
MEIMIVDRHILAKESRIDNLEVFSVTIDLYARKIALIPKNFLRRERQKKKSMA